ncbi:Phospholipase A1 member A [Halotydeus destructor]|nr:Phospholipase A1 member A [Halotydeus destructor]
MMKDVLVSVQSSPKTVAWGRPTLTSNPGSNPDKTSLIFVNKTGFDYIVKYDAFILNDRTRLRAMKRFFYEEREINILIHGWTDHYYRDGWIWSFKEFLLANAKPTPNILIVDWRQWSQSLAISKVKMNVLIVADQLATVLYMLTNEPYSQGMKFDPSKIFIYAHSYGGPIAGRASRRFSSFTGDKQQMGGIMALDPSDQCFGRGSFVELDNSASSNQIFSTYLDASSAYFVKILHTDSNAFGAYWRFGSYDIYVNQGSGQPDCPADFSSVSNIDALFLLACSHYRGTRMMTQAYYKQNEGKCEPVSFRCASFQDFLNGVCACLFTDIEDGTSLLFGSSGQCRQLAANRYETQADGKFTRSSLAPAENLVFSKAADSRDSWYLLMASEPPYCLGNFLYTIRSAEIPNNVASTLQIDDNAEQPIDISTHRRGIIALPAKKISKFNEIKLTYTDLPGRLLGKERQFHFQTLSLFYMSNMNHCVRNQYTRVYCAYNGEFNDTEVASKIVSTKIRFGSNSTEVKFTNARCLQIIEYCAGRDPNEPFVFGSCEAFVIGFLKNFLLPFQDSNCAIDNKRCAKALECLYGFRASYEPGGVGKLFYQTVLDALKADTANDAFVQLLLLSNYPACVSLANEYLVPESQDTTCQIRLFDPQTV